MKLDEILELYSLISKGSANLPERKLSRALRKSGFESIQSGQGFKKVAFDTRRVNQELDYIPRRGLQNYNRSEAFISESMGQRIKNFSKLRNVLDSLKSVYGRDPAWNESNARVLMTNLENGLRTLTKDGDFTDAQPGLGSFDYLEELLHVRYRLTFDDMVKMSEADLKKVILSKDDELTRKDIQQALEITKSDVAKQGYDSLVEKLLEGCRASAENPDVERTITITIRDKFHKEG